MWSLIRLSGDQPRLRDRSSARFCSASFPHFAGLAGVLLLCAQFGCDGDRSCESADDCFAGEVCYQGACRDEGAVDLDGGPGDGDDRQDDVSPRDALDVSSPEDGGEEERDSGNADSKEPDVGDGRSGDLSDVAQDGETDGDVGLVTPEYPKLASGYDFICALASNNRGLCRGDDYNNRLGIPEMKDLTSIGVGGTHGCAALAPPSTGVECWGNAYHGTISDAPDQGNFELVAAASDFSCATPSSNPGVECWGSSDDGGDSPPRFDPVMLSGGRYHMCGIERGTRKLVCWGLGSNVNRNEGGFDYDQASPPFETEKTVIDVAAGGYHTCIIDSDSKIECWGAGEDPSKMKDEHVGQAAPSSEQSMLSYRDVAAGRFHTCAVTREGRVECWGVGTDPTNDMEGREDADQASPPLGTRFRRLVAGNRHTCAVTKSGEVECWGGVGGNDQPPESWTVSTSP